MMKSNEPLAKFTYFKIGGPAKHFAEPSSLEELRELAAFIAREKVKVFILGAGSNLLVADAGFDGLVIRTRSLNNVIRTAGNTLETGGSVMVAQLLAQAVQQGWGGFEFMAGVPGTLGGVVAMNAGTHLGEAAQVLTEVQIFSLFDGGELRTLAGPDLRFAYRKNLFLRPGDLVWSAKWKFFPEAPETVRKKIEDVLVRRKATQPLEFPSCGSVFTNPKSAGIHAWQVIDKVGLRGHRIGNVQFSEKYSNFILNLGGAKAADVLALIRLAQREAREKLNIDLEPEVRFLGFDAGP
jgi:UDP-N-acetylmuramate dehydrogenase